MANWSQYVELGIVILLAVDRVITARSHKSELSEYRAALTALLKLNNDAGQVMVASMKLDKLQKTLDENPALKNLGEPG